MPVAGSGRDDRGALLERLPKGGIGAEIGTLKGDFAARILESLSPRLLYLVDPWLYQGDVAYIHARYGGQQVPGKQLGMDALYEEVLARFDSDIAAGTVEVIRGTSVEVAEGFDDGFFDWVYIDGDHLYESVKADLEVWYRKLQRGGYLTGDDYGHSGWWDDGVTRAVDEFSKGGLCQGPIIIGTQFIFRKP